MNVDPFKFENNNTNSINTRSSFFPSKEYPIPELPLLDDMVAAIEKSEILESFSLGNWVILGQQHMLETTATLLRALRKIGFKPYNMYFSGKCYSSAPEIEAQVRKMGVHLMPSNKPERLGEYERSSKEGIMKMWKQCVDDLKHKSIEGILILDDGGRCLENMPEFIGLKYKVAAVEQTRGGLYSESVNLLPFPLIEVASSAVKKFLESPLIAIAVLNQVKELLPKLELDLEVTTFGVIGNGAIGNALCKYLLSLGGNVVVFDENENAFQHIVDKNLFRVSKREEVINNANIVFGCTGKDVTVGIDLRKLVKKDRIFISCTSEDKEFRSALKSAANENSIFIDTLSDITCFSENGAKITFLRGGFPINFNRKPWNVPANKIEVTQGLLLGGCVQAVLAATKAIGNGVTINHGTRQMLDPYLQQFVAMHWLPRQPKGEYSDKCMEVFNNPIWIRKNSGGTYCPNKLMNQCFNAQDNNMGNFLRSKL